MSYAPHPDEMKAPPPQYSPNNPTNFGMPYQQAPGPDQSPPYGEFRYTLEMKKVIKHFF